MTGISEILVLILLIAGILILPRIFKAEPKGKNTKKSVLKNLNQLTLKTRLLVFLTFGYPFAMAFVLQPWQSNLTVYLLAGVVPVGIAWSIAWILGGRNVK